MYNSSLKHVLDIHAPLKQRMVSSRPDTQWYTSDLRRMKRELRKVERNYKKLLTTSSLDMLKEKCRAYKRELDIARKCIIAGKLKTVKRIGDYTR